MLVTTNLVAAPAITCGQARPDMQVCLSSWALPGGPSGSNLYLQYNNGRAIFSIANPQYGQDPNNENVSWITGAGYQDGYWTKFWLRLDRTDQPRGKSFAQLFYSHSPGSPWIPSTEVFCFGSCH